MDTRAGQLQCTVQLKRDQGLIFHDEHEPPQQWVNGTHNATPITRTKVSVGLN
jgi:hypothetical protein